MTSVCSSLKKDGDVKTRLCVSLPAVDETRPVLPLRALRVAAHLHYTTPPCLSAWSRMELRWVIFRVSLMLLHQAQATTDALRWIKWHGYVKRGEHVLTNRTQYPFVLVNGHIVKHRAVGAIPHSAPL